MFVQQNNQYFYGKNNRQSFEINNNSVSNKTQNFIKFSYGQSDDIINYSISFFSTRCCIKT